VGDSIDIFTSCDIREKNENCGDIMGGVRVVKLRVERSPNPTHRDIRGRNNNVSLVLIHLPRDRHILSQIYEV